MAENTEFKKCEHGWHDGSCCCNCASQLRLMKHPWNKEFGKGAISEQCGWICTAMFEDGSNYGNAIFYDKEHGMCELWRARPENIKFYKGIKDEENTPTK